MKPVASDWTIVLIGSWNMAILNPHWVATEVFAEEQIAVEALIGTGQPEFRYTSGDFLIIPRTDRIVISSSQATDDSASTIENLTCKILEILPVTPISAAGINFGFLEEDVPTSLSGIFSIDDTSNISNEGLEISSTSIIRNIKFEDRTLNFRITQQEDGNIAFHFNFHQQVKNAEEAAESIRGKAICFKQYAEVFLSSIYDLELEDADAA